MFGWLQAAVRVTASWILGDCKLVFGWLQAAVCLGDCKLVFGWLPAGVVYHKHSNDYHQYCNWGVTTADKLIVQSVISIFLIPNTTLQFAVCARFNWPREHYHKNWLKKQNKTTTKQKKKEKEYDRAHYTNKTFLKIMTSPSLTLSHTHTNPPTYTLLI